MKCVVCLNLASSLDIILRSWRRWSCGWVNKLFKIFPSVSSTQLRYSNWSNGFSIPFLLEKTLLISCLYQNLHKYVRLNLISLSSCFIFYRSLLSASKIVNILQDFLWKIEITDFLLSVVFLVPSFITKTIKVTCYNFINGLHVLKLHNLHLFKIT